MLIRIAVLVAVSSLFACAPRPVPVAAPRISPEMLAARLSEADRLASRGCYLCLKEAAAAYAALLGETDDPRVALRALENNLMLAVREIELRIPDSGALDAARQLQDHVGVNYLPYFGVVDHMMAPLVAGGMTLQAYRGQREERLKATAGLEQEAPSSAMKAYVFLAAVLPLREFKELKSIIGGILSAHPQDLSLKYQMLSYQPMYSAQAARDLIGHETGFGEVHLLIGQRAFLSGNLPLAFRELTRARELLPDSATIVLALANVTFSYARYADALELFGRVLSSPAAQGLEPQAKMGRAKSLSYLRRHDEAVALLTDLLQNDARNTPGDKYYWRAWNQLQLGRAQLAYNDATEGLNAMRNDAIYRLAGMASFGLSRSGEARGFFQEALKMNSADCDSERYIGLLDSAEHSWKPAIGRFSVAAKCYEVVIARLREELTEYEKDITGLSNGLIAAKRLEIREASALRDQSILNVAAATRNAEAIK